MPGKKNSALTESNVHALSQALNTREISGVRSPRGGSCEILGVLNRQAD